MMRTTRYRSIGVLAVAILVVVVGRHRATANDDNTPRVDYKIKGIHYELHSTWSSKTEPTSRLELTLHTRANHNLHHSVRFLVIGIQGYNNAQQHQQLRLNPASSAPPPDGKDLPLSVQIDPVTTAVFFDPPLPYKQVRDFDLVLTIPSELMGALHDFGFITRRVGYEPKDAISLLGDPLLSEELRAKMASWLGDTTGRRYRYITDDGRWITSKALAESLPLASPEEQVTASTLTLADTAGHRSDDRGSEIDVTNATDQDQRVWIAGGGREQWIHLAAKGKAIVEVDDGLQAIAIIREGKSIRYASYVELIQPKARYTLDLE